MKDKVKMFRGKYAFLSNMHEASFVWDGRTYSNSEAAYQSAKALDPAVRDEFSRMSGVAAKRAGKNVLLRGDWEAVKDNIMEDIVRAKFSQNPDLLNLLVETGDMELIEGNRWHDKYWGVDIFSGIGENHLGIILMRIREELGGSDFREKAEKMQAEREEINRREEKARQAEIENIKSQIADIPECDFVGMEFGTKAFGRVKITRREGDYLFFEARGAEKKFVLPGCIVQGFLIPDDKSVVENFVMKQKLMNMLEEVRRAG